MYSLDIFPKENLHNIQKGQYVYRIRRVKDRKIDRIGRLACRRLRKGKNEELKDSKNIQIYINL